MLKHSKHIYLPVDLAAVCSVAFLLLLLYVSMARPKYPDPLNIQMPASSGYKCNISGFGEGMLLIGQGRVMLQINGVLRRQTLQNMAQKHSMHFTPAEIAKFEAMDIIGVPLSELKSYLATYKIESKAYYSQLGIKLSIEENELGDWIQAARQADITVNYQAMRIAIKADKNTEYPLIKRVISTLQSQDINRFSLITEIKPFGYE